MMTWPTRGLRALLRFRPFTLVRIALCAALLPWISACDPPAMTENGVLSVVGELGLGPGDFSYPRALATAAGKVFVVDKTGRVQRFTDAGQYEIGWRMPVIQFGKPVGMSIHPDGRLFIADTHNSRIAIYDAEGRELAAFGENGEGDGQFLLPTDVAFDTDGHIYVAEYGGNDRITKWSPQLEFVRVVSDQPIEGHRFGRPSAIDIDDEQTLWVADSCNHRLVRMTLDGEVLAVFGRMGREPGELRYPYDLDVTSQGEILVCEYGNDRLQWFSKEGVSLRTWGGSGREPGSLHAPWGAEIGPNGLLYVVDSLNNRLQIIRP